MRDRDLVAVGLPGLDPPLRLERLHHGDPRGQRLHAGVGLARLLAHAPALADHGDLVEAVVAPDLEVVGIVAGGDL
jgi:hypothetical protein